MSQTAVLVWLSVAELIPAFRTDLEHFSQARLLRLEPPRDNAAAAQNAAYAPDVVLQIEQALEEARNATAALDPNAAQAALEHADQLLHAHAALPQAAWLMAERLDLAAELEARTPEGADAALALRQRAAALEGRRAEPFSDRETAPVVPPLVTRALALEGPSAEDVVEWDGVRLASSSLTSADGEHQVRVLRNGRLAWAGWVRVSASDVALHLAVPPVEPCSLDDLAHAHFDGQRAVAAAHARCESYVLARPHAGGGVDVALCQKDHCAETSIWKALPVTSTLAPAPSRWPLWASYAVASVMVVGSGVLIWRSGAFDKPEPRTETSWVYTGSRPAARF